MSQGLLLKYFVIKPRGSNVYAKASREAMLRYAEVIKSINPVFTDDIKDWVKKEQLLAIGETYGNTVSYFKRYERTNIAEMRPYLSGQDMTDISVADIDKPDHDMGMIARNPENHKDQWYVARKYFEENFKEIE